jgi:hypothetical protein
LLLLGLFWVSACTGPAPTGGALPGSPHYHGLAASDELLVLTTHDGVFTSTDGSSWGPMDHPAIHPVAVAVGKDAEITVGGQGAVIRTRSSGWETVEKAEDLLVKGLIHSGGRLVAWVVGEGLRTLPRDRTDPGESMLDGPDDGLSGLASVDGLIVAVGTNFGAFASTDGGETWRDLVAPGPLTAVAIHDPDTLFAGGVDAVWRYRDGTWERMDLEPAGPIAAMAFQDDVLWVLTQAGGLHRSGDLGGSWVLHTAPG